MLLWGWTPTLEFPKIRGTLYWGPYKMDPTISTWGLCVRWREGFEVWGF